MGLCLNINTVVVLFDSSPYMAICTKTFVQGTICIHSTHKNLEYHFMFILIQLRKYVHTRQVDFAC